MAITTILRQSLFLLLLIPCAALAQDEADLRRADYDRLKDYVLETPENIKQDPQAIVQYLKKGAKSERERTELIYFWVAHNIAYDVESYSKGSYAQSDGSTTLKNGKAVCQGYAELFKQLCDHAKIECVVITGFAKGYSYQGKPLDEPNHTWNAVKLGKEWKLIDVTWGSGYVETENDTLVFQRSINLGYLFSKPEGFIIEHLPVETKWQLLRPPLSKVKFYSKEMDEKKKHVVRYL